MDSGSAGRAPSLIISVTGASGSLYAAALIRGLSRFEGGPSTVIISNAAVRVYREEINTPVDGPADVLYHILSDIPENNKKHRFFLSDSDDIGAPPASGSAPYSAMIIIPCSMKTLAAVSNGLASNLTERAADVMLKERKRLIAVTRETPLSLIHLKNMTALTEAGGIIMPASPGFYHRPETLNDLADFIAGRALSLAGIPNSLHPVWEG